jgi:hypothetical protein
VADYIELVMTNGMRFKLPCKDRDEQEAFTADNLAETLKSVNGGYLEGQNGWLINVNQIIAMRDGVDDA